MTEYTPTATSRDLSISHAGWLFVAASGAFSLVIVSMVGGLAAAGFPTTEPITHDGTDPIAFWRAAVGWTFLVPVGLAGAASVILARVARRGAAVIAGMTFVLWASAGAAAIAYAVSWQVSLGFTTATILEDPARSFALVAFGRVAMPLIALGSAGAALCLRSVGTSRRALLVVAAIAAALAIAFASGVHDVAPVPPAILVAAWIPLGVSAIRQGRRIRKASVLPVGLPA